LLIAIPTKIAALGLRFGDVENNGKKTRHTGFFPGLQFTVYSLQFTVGFPLCDTANLKVLASYYFDSEGGIGYLTVNCKL
jgi:hypothetical protein